METYLQEYQLCNALDAERTVAAILGPGNMEHVRAKRPGLWEEYIRQAREDGFVVLGQILFSLSVYPMDARLIFIEGWGRHSVFNRRTRELVATTQFSLVDDGPHWLTEVGTGSLTVRAHEQTTREFVKDVPRYVREAEVFIRIYVKEEPAGVLTIDYDAAHDIGIDDMDRGAIESAYRERGNTVVPWKREGGGPFRIIRRIGTIRFNDRHDGRKILDLRGYQDTLRNDYRRVLNRDPNSPTASDVTLVWDALPACAPRPAAKAGH